MNKYQEAYSYIKHYCELDDDFLKWPLAERSMKTFKELVDKETPKIPKRKRLFYNCHNGECDKAFIYYCPVCNFSSVEDMNYCPNCGQKLDWSDE